MEMHLFTSNRTVTANKHVIASKRTLATTEEKEVQRGIKGQNCIKTQLSKE